MPLIKIGLEFPIEFQLNDIPALIDMRLCGKQHYQNARNKDRVIMDWLMDKLALPYPAMFGEYKKVVDATTGIAYKVPTMHIVRFGLKQTELPNFPKWKDNL